jgi:histone deacetylase 11
MLETERLLSRRNVLVAAACLVSGSLGWTIVNELFDEIAGSHRASILPGLVPLIYSSRYNMSAFGLEHLHPFDAQKFSKIQQHLIGAGLRATADFVRPFELSREQLLTVHSSDYLESLKASVVLARILEVPAASVMPSALIDWRILHPMRLAGGGTLVACRLALLNGLAINLGGGYHHADRNDGGGFCVYSDVPIALKILHQEGKFKNVLIVDTDAHQGNGFANVLRESGWAHIVDLFDESIYPYPKVVEDMSVPLRAKTDGDTYLAILMEIIPKAVSRFEPDLIVYNAGSDVLATDPLSSLLLSPEQMCTRDLYVVSQARERRIPLAMVLSGGYGAESAPAHARSIESILRQYDQI